MGWLIAGTDAENVSGNWQLQEIGCGLNLASGQAVRRGAAESTKGLRREKIRPCRIAESPIASATIEFVISAKFDSMRTLLPSHAISQRVTAEVAALRRIKVVAS